MSIGLVTKHLLGLIAKQVTDNGLVGWSAPGRLSSRFSPGFQAILRLSISAVRHRRDNLPSRFDCDPH